jgi:hypothetical protein
VLTLLYFERLIENFRSPCSHDELRQSDVSEESIPPSAPKVCHYGLYAYGVAALGAQLEDRPVFLQNHAVGTQMLDGVPELRLSIL